jgi:hypothetical protein
MSVVCDVTWLEIQANDESKHRLLELPRNKRPVCMTENCHSDECIALALSRLSSSRDKRRRRLVIDSSVITVSRRPVDDTC